MIKDIKGSIIRLATLTFLISLLTLILIFAAGVVEKQNNPNFDFSPGTMLWWWLVTISTVGYGDIAPVTPIGRLMVGTVIAVGWIYFAIIITELSNIFRLIHKFGERGLRSIDYTDHVIIIGYSALTEGIVDSIRKKYDDEAKIVLISDKIDINPFEGIDFVQGNALMTDVLGQANIEEASIVFVLAEEGRTNPDSYSLVVANKIENFDREIFSIVEITSNDVKELYEDSAIDKFIPHTQLLEEILTGDSPVMNRTFEIIDETLVAEKEEKNKIIEQFGNQMNILTGNLNRLAKRNLRYQSKRELRNTEPVKSE